MTQILYHNPGQSVTIVLETLNNVGTRADALSLPTVDRIILPSLTLAADYPQQMIRIDTGLYYFKFILPTGSSSVGTYIADISYIDATTSVTKNVAYQIIVTVVTGNFGIVTAV